MRRFATWQGLLYGVLLASGAASAAEPLSDAQSATVIGPVNPLLADGTTALQMGRFEEGVRLTLAGLKQPSSPHDEAAGHSNVCAGFAALKRWEEALEH